MRIPIGEKKLEGKFTLTAGHEDEHREYGMKIDIIDDKAGVQFLEIELKADDFVAAIGGRGFCPCTLTIRGLDKVGKVHENTNFEFEIPQAYGWNRNKEELVKLARAMCPEGWQPDTNFNSQGSFFNKGGKSFARTIIRRYVDPEV